jgi:small subunit ribosomal protein S9
MAKKTKGIQVKAKKKTAVARAVIREGTGKIKINKLNVETKQEKYIKEFIKEPLAIAGEIAKKYDIDIKVKGGGIMGQAVAARATIAKALVKITKDEKLKKAFLNYDRNLLVDDIRRKEAKKPLGRGARKSRQTSYR